MTKKSSKNTSQFHWILVKKAYRLFNLSFLYAIYAINIRKASDLMSKTIPLEVREVIYDVFLTLGSVFRWKGRIHKECVIVVSKALFCCFTLEMLIERSFVSRLPSIKSLSKIQIQIFFLIRRFVSDLVQVHWKNWKFTYYVNNM